MIKKQVALFKVITYPFVQHICALGTTHLLVACHYIDQCKATVMVQVTFILFNGPKLRV